MTRQMLKGIRVKSKEELTNRLCNYFAEINEEPIVFHWKYNLDDIDVSEEIIVDTLPAKKSSESKDEILGLLQDFKMCKRVYQTFTEFKCVFLISNYNNKIFSRI